METVADRAEKKLDAMSTTKQAVMGWGVVGLFAIGGFLLGRKTAK